MINKNITDLITEIQAKPSSVEVLNHNRIDITNDVAMIAFKVPKLANVCPTGFHTDTTSGYCIANDIKGKPKPYFKLSNVCPKGTTSDSSSGYCKPIKK